jgi:hypothetical protein
VTVSISVRLEDRCREHAFSLPWSPVTFPLLGLAEDVHTGQLADGNEKEEKL